MNKKNRTKGFTLVELLAVIVILAIILVIAVPKVMSIIEDAKMGTLESTAKMIASAAEKQKVQNTVLGNTEEITCDSVAKINKGDYANCSIEFDNNTAKVTIEGSDKFEGLYVCSGTKTNATAQKQGCVLSTLTVDLDGGNDNNTQYKEKYEAGAIVTLAVPTKEYYEFKEWIIVSGTDAIVEGNTLTIGKTDTEVRAVWEDMRTYTNFTITSSNRSKIGYKGEDGEVLNIPANFYDEDEEIWYKVSSIGTDAFRDCSKLIGIIIPDSVSSIGTDAFLNCSNLESIIVDSENNYFRSIDGIVFNKNLTKLIKYPSAKMDTIYDIPNTVISIGRAAFDDCSNLTSITIPNTVTSIEQSAFSGCSSLTSITIPNTVTAIKYGTFSDCSSLTSITIPNTVTSIEMYAFYRCLSLTNIIIPNSVTSIGTYAFKNSGLTSVIIPNSVTSIGNEAFSSCSNLISITISNSVTSIGREAFSNCSSITSVVIPSSVTSLDNDVFLNCHKLESIIVDSENQKYRSIDGVLFNKNLTILIKYPEAKTVTTYDIPNTVTSIWRNAFDSCENLTSVTMSDLVTTIGYGAFSSCYNLTSITIPHSVTTIGNYAFDICRNLKDVYYSGTEEQWNTIIKIGNNNTYLTKATIHYETTVSNNNF